MSLFSSEVNRLFGDIYGVRATLEWQYRAFRKTGRNWTEVASGNAVGMTADEAIASLVKMSRVLPSERVSLGGKTYRIWDAGAGRAWTVVDRTPRSRKGDRARAREAQAAALRSS